MTRVNWTALFTVAMLVGCTDDDPQVWPPTDTAPSEMGMDQSSADQSNPTDSSDDDDTEETDGFVSADLLAEPTDAVTEEAVTDVADVGLDRLDDQSDTPNTDLIEPSDADDLAETADLTEDDTFEPSPICRDECEEGSSGCSDGDGQRWDCGEDDLDACWDRIYETCEVDTPCQRGICQGTETCQDACAPLTSGCTDSSEQWQCAQADEDPCLERVVTPCVGEDECHMPGICAPSDTVGCGDITYECQGDTLVYCEDGTLRHWDCLEQGLYCALYDELGHLSCVNEDGCRHACAYPWRDCDITGSKEIICEDIDADGCLELTSNDCTGESACSHGECQPGLDCLDECRQGEVGCVDSVAEVRWRCLDGEDEDACLDAVETMCKAGEVCINGACIPTGPPTCGDITIDGECQGDLLVYCFEEQLYLIDCYELGLVCRPMTVAGFMGCREPS